MKHFGVSEKPIVLEDTWSESLVEFLTSPTVTGILFFLGIFLAYMELNAPGHIVPGILAAVCFAILFGSRFLIGMSDWWQIALFVVGIVLIVVELVTFHTMGLLLVAGLLCCVVGLLAILAPHVPGTLPIPQTEMDWGIFKSGILGLGLGFIGAVVAAMLFARYLPSLPVAGKLVLKPLLVPSESPVSEHAAFKEVQVGDVGVAETLCRPVGKVRFGDRLLNAASTGDVLQPGDRVKVLKRDGNRLIVEKA
jgi:membrane-bound serine protease (ClpP class)